MIIHATEYNKEEQCYDTFDTDEMHKILFESDILTGEKNEQIDYSVELFVDEKKEKDNLYAKLIGTLTNKDLGKENQFELIPIQIFVDDCQKAAKDMELLDDINQIKEAKEKIKIKFAKLLLDNGYVFENVEYEAFGYLYSNDEKIGTFEEIILNQNKIRILDHYCAVELSKIVNPSLEFILKNKKYSSPLESFTDNNLFTLSNLTTTEVDEGYNVTPKSNFSSEEEMIKDRRKLLFDVDKKKIDLTEFMDLF